MDEIHSRLLRPGSSDKSLQSNGSSYTPPPLDHEIITAPPTRPCSWIWESEFVLNTLPSSPRSSHGASTPPSSLPTPNPPKYEMDMSDPSAPVPDGMVLTQEEVQRRYNLFRPEQRTHFVILARRGAEFLEDLTESEEVWSTAGEKMYVRKVLELKLFRNWNWDSASSQHPKATTKEQSSASEDEDVYDEDEEEEGDISDDPGFSFAFYEQRDSIEVLRESRGRQSPTEEPIPQGSLTQGLRRVTRKLIDAIQSRRASPRTSGSISPASSYDDDEHEDEDGDVAFSSPDASPKRRSMLRELVWRGFSRPSRRQQQKRPKRGKHEPCHRSRSPNAPLLKNADEPICVVPPWSDCIGPRDELLNDLYEPFCDLAVTTDSGDAAINNNENTAEIVCCEAQKSIAPGQWLSGRC
ncbi:hypothetical protein PG994_010621 [Apiospora phragmitis]|uniref:Uncharacterized protein n=1 Tax=Apiospora phragmitis TaxID=2905665 RepID=A0ABR1TSN5_9PEZI